MAKVLLPGTNLNEVKPWDGEVNLLPPGEYLFEVMGCTLGNSSKGNPQLEFDLTVVQGALTDTLDGAKSKHWVVMTDKSAGRVRCIVDACGVPMEADGSFDSDHFIGTQFIAEVQENSYEKDDLASGTKVVKTNTKIVKERPVSAGFADGGVVQEQPEAEAPAAQAAPVAPAQPTVRRVGPAAPPAQAALPKVASSLRPGARAPIPGRK
jgi:hypothetical protein